jgi:hypothetical protein
MDKERDEGLEPGCKGFRNDFQRTVLQRYRHELIRPSDTNFFWNEDNVGFVDSL